MLKSLRLFHQKPLNLMKLSTNCWVVLESSNSIHNLAETAREQCREKVSRQFSVLYKKHQRRMFSVRRGKVLGNFFGNDISFSPSWDYKSWKSLWPRFNLTWSKCNWPYCEWKDILFGVWGNFFANDISFSSNWDYKSLKRLHVNWMRWNLIGRTGNQKNIFCLGCDISLSSLWGYKS